MKGVGIGILSVASMQGAAAQTPASNGLHDIRPPVPIGDSLAWLWWALAALLVAALLGLAIWQWWRARNPEAPAVEEPLSPYRAALNQLQDAWRLIEEPKPFCSALSDTVRHYLEAQFQLRAPERTTEEFLPELTATPKLAQSQKERLHDFLGQCDLVKFAGHHPTVAELKTLHSTAATLIEETYFSQSEHAEASSSGSEESHPVTLSTQ